MLHEFQYKALGDDTNPEGQSLFDNPPKKWGGLGHGPGFYTAIIDRAAYFGITYLKSFCQSI